MGVKAQPRALLAKVPGMKLAEMPDGVRRPQFVLLGILGGIGFTLSIFIANLAFEDRHVLAAAKFGVLVGSALAAALALTLGRAKSVAPGTGMRCRASCDLTDPRNPL